MYILIPNGLPTAKLISQRLWEITAPLTPGNITTHLITWLIHPVTAAAAVHFPQDLEIPIKPTADGSRAAGALNLPTNEASDLKTAVIGYRGQQIPLWVLLPDRVKNNARTREQMELDGWFAQSITTNN